MLERAKNFISSTASLELLGHQPTEVTKDRGSIRENTNTRMTGTF